MGKHSQGRSDQMPDAGLQPIGELVAAVIASPREPAASPPDVRPEGVPAYHPVATPARVHPPGSWFADPDPVAPVHPPGSWFADPDPVAPVNPPGSWFADPDPARSAGAAPAALPRPALAAPVAPARPAVAAPAAVPGPVAAAAGGSAPPPLPPVPAFRSDTRDQAPVPALVTPGRAVRREIAKARRTRRITRAGVATVIVGALAAGGIATLAVHAAAPAAKHAPTLPPLVRTQRTLLFALSDPGGDEAALLASDPSAHTASVTLLPSRVVTSVAGGGQLPLGKAVALPDRDNAAGAISDLMGVDVDNTWRLTPQALAGLVDALGGITVNVDTDIINNGTVVLHAGSGQHVGGANAVALAQYLAAGEDESARLARLQSVLDGLLTALPAQPESLAAAVGALGAGSDSSATPADLAAQLRSVQAGHAASGSAGPLFSILPVTALDSGGAVPAYRIDAAATAVYVQANLAASVPPGFGRGGVRVFVYSGTLQYGLGVAARKKLVAAGMSFVGSGNEASPSTAPSVVLVPDGTDASRAMGLRVAVAMGLPRTSVEVSNVPQNVADVIVIAGGDFRF